jgi:tetratricopeptide (TPR) repeat protein
MSNDIIFAHGLSCQRYFCQESSCRELSCREQKDCTSLKISIFKHYKTTELVKYSIFIFFIFLSFLSCHNKPSDQTKSSSQVESKSIQGYSLTGAPLISLPPANKVLSDFEKYKNAYRSDTTQVDLLIWYGRFAAYTGDYLKAIDIYSNGINRFPDDARLYRHRGHRYISIRRFDEAISDLEKAAQLIEGTENEIEPDGMPNAQNIPVSTLHGNIWYHLGLAYYLKQDFPNALRAYENCLASGSKPDNIVSATHWLYMIARRMGDTEKANSYLEPIEESMPIIENMSYHRNCLFYKGLISEEELMSFDGAFSAVDATRYALGNWHYYNGNLEKARDIYMGMLESKAWNSFGYIAAEADLKNM